jgi:hypothetical protein
MVSFLDLVMIGSAYTLNALALAKVVVIRLWVIKEIVRLAIKALLCEAVLPNLFTLFPCLMMCYD